MLKRFSVFAIAGLLTTSALAQSPFRDGSSSSSLYGFNTGGFWNYNTSDSTARLSYLYDLSGQKNWFGFEIFGKLDDKLANIFERDRLTTNAGVHVSFGRRHIAWKRLPQASQGIFEYTDPHIKSQVLTLFGVKEEKELPPVLLDSDGEYDEEAYRTLLANIVKLDVTDENKVRGFFGYKPGDELFPAITSGNDRTRYYLDKNLIFFRKLVQTPLNNTSEFHTRLLFGKGINDQMPEFVGGSVHYKDYDPSKAKLLIAKLNPLLAKKKIEESDFRKSLDILNVDELPPASVSNGMFDPEKTKYMIRNLVDADSFDRDKILPLFGYHDQDALPRNLRKGDYNFKKVTNFLRDHLASENIFESKEAPLWRDDPFDQLVLDLGANRSSYRFFDGSLPESERFSTQGFTGYSASLAYNVLVNRDRWYGISLGYQKDNNIGDLKQVDVVQNQEISPGTSITKTTKAFTGDFETVTRMPLSLDAVTWPRQFGGRVGVNFFARMDLSHTKETFVPGLGIFLSEKGAPTKVVGGITLTIKDGRINGGLMVGFNF